MFGPMQDGGNMDALGADGPAWLLAAAAVLFPAFAAYRSGKVRPNDAA